jgi:anaerobic magnesium-protoporphyrin IX monomethyl ester cyclase
MNCLLIYPLVESTSAGKKMLMNKPMVPSLGLLYIGRSLEENNHNIEIIDLNAENIKHIKLEKLVKWADVIGLSVLTISLEYTKNLINKIKEIAPNKKVIIGGPHCSLYPKKSLIELNADICVEGDGENVINDIIEDIKQKNHLSEIPGVYYKEKNGKIKKCKEAKLIKNIDSIKFPARHLVKKYRYGQIILPNIGKEKFTSIITSRGCPHRCSYCTRHFLGMKKYRFRSVDNVIEELREVYREGYRYVVIVDDSFLTNGKRVYQIMDEIIKEGLKFKIFIQGARVDSANEKLYKKMKEAGVVSIGFGIESGNQDVLDFYRKGITLDQIRRAVSLSRKMGFFTLGSFILGAPFETKKHFKNTIRFACSLPLDAVTFFPLEYRAGSDIWYEAVNQDKISDDEYAVRGGLERDLSIFKKEEISNYCKKAQRYFYLRPTFLIDEVIQALIKKDFTFIKAAVNFLKMI